MTRMSVVALVLVAAGFAGCKSDECQRLRAEYARTIQAQKAELAKVDANSPAQIALQVHEDLLTSVVHDALTGRKSLYRAEETIAGGNKLSAKVSLTRAKVRFGRGCNDCLEIDGRMAMDSTIRAAGVNIFRGKGGADLTAQVPLRLDVKDGDSALVVDLRKVKIRKLSVRGASGRLPWNRILGDAAQKLLRTGGTEITVARWKPLELPGTSVKLTAKELKVFRAEKTAWLGFAVGVPADGPGLVPEATLRRKETVAVSFTGNVLTRLTQEMLLSGAVPNRLDEDFKPDPGGHQMVTVTDVKPDGDGLETLFTLWRLPPEEDECYAVDVKARTLVQVKRSRGGKTPVHLKMTDGEVVETRGDDSLLQIGLWLRSVFVSDALEAQTRILAADTIEFGPLGKQRVDIQRVDYAEGGVTVAGAMTARSKSKR